LAICLSTVFSVSAAKNTPITKKKLRIEIVSILGNKISVELKKPNKAEISFMINSQNEIVIISVESDIDELKTIIKGKLNYKKVEVKGTKKGEIYKIPLRINTK
jgi:hypothetical protein